VKGENKTSSIKEIARQRIDILFGLAEKEAKTNPNLSRRYVELARKIAMSAKTPFPRQYRRVVCKNCNSMLVHGYNCRVRIQQKREPHVVVTCLNCGKQIRYMLNKKEHKVNEQQNNNKNETPRAARIER
jgi:ribonuclease P protein subunit RPR2